MILLNSFESIRSGFQSEKEKGKKKKKRLLSIASASRKHTEGKKRLSKNHVHGVLVCYTKHRYEFCQVEKYGTESGAPAEPAFTS
jgi:hypothetical protein